MDLERMTLRLRPRSSWEALDLGLALARSHGARMYLAWFAVYAPVALVAFVVFQDSPFWAWLLLWWLKPLFDRVVLEVLSVELFGGQVRVGAILRRLPSLSWRSGIVGALTWRRFDFARSFHLPVYQLERLSGKASRQRIRVLDREARGAAVWLTFLLLNVELIFGLGISLAVAMLLPVQTPLEVLWETWARGTLGADASMLRGALLSMLAVSAIEPLYVACGFTLYLQRRTVLEGWDIELRFRQLAARSESAPRSPSAGAASVAAALLFIASFALAPATPATAGEPLRASKEIRQVLKDPDFGHEEQQRHFKYVGPEWHSNISGPELDWKWLEALLRLGARAARVAAWVAGCVVVAFLLYYLARYVRLHGYGQGRRARPDFLFGLDVRPESLPADVASTAEALARAVRVREALSLLYRASLVRFIDEGLEFTQGDTESDCVRRVERTVAPRRRIYFNRLVNAWQVLAYGHRPISPAVAEEFAREWRAVFPMASAEPAPGAQVQPA